MEKTGFDIVALCNCAVEAPVVYVISGTDLTLNCEINGSIILTDQVSWKHNGVWLHNFTHRVDRKLQLVIPRIHEQQHGVYQCSVFNVSKQSVNLLPRDANVTVLIGARIRKPQCESNGRIPPTTLLLWNTVKNEQSDLQFTYHVLFCYNPSSRNKFCLHPPRGYSMFKHCPAVPLDLQSNNIKPISECNVTLLFKTLFPNMFDPTKAVSGTKIHFVISFGNVQSESYSNKTICDPTKSVKCTKPDNIRTMNVTSRTFSFVWDAPKDMNDLEASLHYLLVITAADTSQNKTVDFVSLDRFKMVNLSHSFIKLRPYALYHVYIACSVSPVLGDSTTGEYIGPFSVRTLEEEPGGHPRIDGNMKFTVHGKYRDVGLKWTLPNTDTWNGRITHFVLHYKVANESEATAEPIAGQVKVLSIVSNTTGNLTDLWANETYAVTIQMCTRVGCGPVSHAIYIPVIKVSNPVKPSREPGPKERSNYSLIVGLVTGIILLCVLSAFIAIYFWKKKPRFTRQLLKLSSKCEDHIFTGSFIANRPKNSRLPLSEVIKDKDTSPSSLYEMRYGRQESDGEYDVVSPSDRNMAQRSDSQTEQLKTEILEEDV
ncbi:uncharacterized protein LOC114961760 isoform X2 [Acropora millepora]|uniref:uncharacterized protein LOC114961760 isoform X2 n=1 Tax=Acropora millepora TaxID=45264 RepID=UPI001CF1385A|nr:uncharacterized protein LOC114961760 isoform X2 [Acropora millepora]